MTDCFAALEACVAQLENLAAPQTVAIHSSPSRSPNGDILTLIAARLRQHFKNPDLYVAEANVRLQAFDENLLKPITWMIRDE